MTNLGIHHNRAVLITVLCRDVGVEPEPYLDAADQCAVITNLKTYALTLRKIVTPRPTKGTRQ